MSINSGRTSEPVEILYIIGSGRSGSTLLGNLLGSQPDFANVGEVYNFRHFFDTADEHERNCSCGSRLDRCPFWQKVISLSRAQLDTDTLDLKYGDNETLVMHNHAMLSAIRDITGKRVIVDSSKRVNRLQMLLSSERFRVTVLHLVRDGRAFAFSAMTSAIKRKLPHKCYFFRRLLKWQNKNIGIRFLFGHLPAYHLIRYEEFVREPDKVLGEIAGWHGSCFDARLLERQQEADIHEFSGNSDVISRKALEVRQDTRYLEQLDTTLWTASSLVTVGGLKMFGYPFRRSRCGS